MKFSRSTHCPRANFRAAGQSLVIVGLFMVALFGFAAFSIDIGKLYVNKKKLQNGTDAAALAAAMELPPTSDTDAGFDEAARAYADANQLKSSEVTAVEVGHYDATSRTFNVGGSPIDSVRVAAERDVKMSFAMVVGIKSLRVRAHSVSQIFAATAVTETLPWVIEFDTNAPPSLCQDFTLRFETTPNTGGWTPPDDSMSADDYRARIVQGYEHSLSTGESVKLVPGLKTGPNQQGVDYRIDLDPSATCATVENGSPRLITVPFIPPGTMETCAGCTMPVGGFASFFLVGTSADGKTVFGQYHHVFNGTTATRDPVNLYSPSAAVLVE